MKWLLTGAAAVLSLLVVGLFENVAAAQIDYLHYQVVSSSDWEFYTFPPGADDQVRQYVANLQSKATARIQYFVNKGLNGGITLRLRFLSTPDVSVMIIGNWTTSIQEARRLRDNYRRRGYDAHVQRDSDNSFIE